MINLLLQISWSDLETRVGDERLSSILWCAGIVLATFLLKKPLATLIAKISYGISNRFRTKQQGMEFRLHIRRPLELLLQTLLYYIAINQMSIFLQHAIYRKVEGKQVRVVTISDAADRLFMFLMILFATLLISRIVDFAFKLRLERAYEEDNKEKQQLFPLIREVSKILLWTLGVFWILGSVFEVNIPALVTGLGIGGVAIALAAKESVENFFASFTILTDNPFQTGDTVRLGSLEGVVERIGFRSTRLRNADGSLYVIPNKKLVNENLENLTQRDTRRVRIVVNIKYGISSADLQKLIDELKEMIQKTLHVMQPIEISLESFGENVFQLVISYHLPEPIAEGGNVAMVKQEINMRTYEIVTKYTGHVSVQSNPTQEEAPSDSPQGGEEESEI